MVEEIKNEDLLKRVFDYWMQEGMRNGEFRDYFGSLSDFKAPISTVIDCFIEREDGEKLSSLNDPIKVSQEDLELIVSLSENIKAPNLYVLYGHDGEIYISCPFFDFMNPEFKDCFNEEQKGTIKKAMGRYKKFDLYKLGVSEPCREFDLSSVNGDVLSLLDNGE